MATTSSMEEVARAYCSLKGMTFVTIVGAGAFKETFHVKNGKGDSLAVKLFRSDFSAERTAREIEAMRRCSHENIAHLVEIEDFAWHGKPYVVITEEYLAGGTLSERLKKNGLLNSYQLRELARPLVEALAHIASLNLVHRDLKPDNILFRDDGSTPVIVDFGLVRDLGASSLTQSWAVRGPGTPLFSAPEQLRNEKALIDWRSDQFSLGVLLAYAAFDMHPYEHPGDTAPTLVERVANRGVQSPTFDASARRSGLAALIKMTAAWPVQRLRTPSLLINLWS